MLPSTPLRAGRTGRDAEDAEEGQSYEAAAPHQTKRPASRGTVFKRAGACRFLHGFRQSSDACYQSHRHEHFELRNPQSGMVRVLRSGS